MVHVVAPEHGHVRWCHGGMYQGTAPMEYMTPGKPYESAMPAHGMTHGKAAIPLPYIGRAEERMQ